MQTEVSIEFLVFIIGTGIFLLGALLSNVYGRYQPTPLAEKDGNLDNATSQATFDINTVEELRRLLERSAQVIADLERNVTSPPRSATAVDCLSNEERKLAEKDLSLLNRFWKSNLGIPPEDLDYLLLGSLRSDIDRPVSRNYVKKVLKLKLNRLRRKKRPIKACQVSDALANRKSVGNTKPQISGPIDTSTALPIKPKASKYNEANSPTGSGKSTRALTEHNEASSPTGSGEYMETSSTTMKLSAEDVLQLDEAINRSVTSPSQKNELRKWLLEYSDLWANERRGRIKDVEHTIRIQTDKPIVSAPRRYSEEQQQIISKEVKKMINDGVICQSASCHSSEVVLVSKKTGDGSRYWRMALDYRKINRETQDDRFPLPRIWDLLRSIKDSTHFITFDLRSGYWQISMAKESRHLTAFRTNSGLYEFCVMPFGLKTAPATFQRMMADLLGDLRYKGVLVYIDDVMIHAKSYEACFSLANEVLTRFRNANATFNLKKSRFFPEAVEYLGVEVRHGTLRPLQERIRYLKQLQSPTTVSELRHCLGAICCLQNFIPNLSVLLGPLSDLLVGSKEECRQSSKPIEWTLEREKAFRRAIDIAATSELHVPFTDDDFEIHTNTSDDGIGAALYVKRQALKNDILLVECMSRKFTQVQKRWSVKDKEAYGIVLALQTFDTFIRYQPIRLVIQHQTSLQWMLEAKEGKASRWACILSDYDITVVKNEPCILPYLNSSEESREDIELLDRLQY